ncbi:MAG: type II toxin-antitoxin system RelE/ParE family toxin [Pirellulales bacterium]
MAVELIVSPEAEDDLNEAYAWYEARRTGLGGDFLSRVDACIQIICRSPEIHPCVQAEYRRALVRRFPFAVFFEAVSNTVTVYAVFHTSRDPEKWRQRLK